MQLRSLVVAYATMAAVAFAEGSVATASASASAQPSPLTFNWTLHDTDALLQYSSQAGASDWSLSPDIDSTQSSVSGANVSLSFVGSAVSFIGTAARGQVALLIDNVPVQAVPPSSPSVLAEAQVPFKYHCATLQLLSGSVDLQAVVVSTGMYTLATSMQDVSIADEHFVSDSNTTTPFYHFGGQWTQEPSTESHAGASFWASVPANTSMVVINGTSPSEGSYSVNITPAPPYSFPNTTLHTAPSISPQINLYMVPLDPEVRYNLSMTVGENSTISLHATSFYSALLPASNDIPPPTSSPDSAPASSPSTGSTSSTNVAAIAGGAAGGGVGLILILLVVWLLYRRHRRSKLCKSMSDDDVSITPHIPMPSGLHSRSHSVLGIGSFLASLSATTSISASQGTPKATAIPHELEHEEDKVEELVSDTLQGEVLRTVSVFPRQS